MSLPVGYRFRFCRRGRGPHGPDYPRTKHGSCAACGLSYHRRYNQRFKARIAAQEVSLRQRWMHEAMLALGGRCADCGHDDRRVLQFDHVVSKHCNVSHLAGRMEAAFWAEVGKCDLVCANCHVLRTRSRA